MISVCHLNHEKVREAGEEKALLSVEILTCSAL